MSDFGHEIGVQRETYTKIQNDLEKILLNRDCPLEIK